MRSNRLTIFIIVSLVALMFLQGYFLWQSIRFQEQVFVRQTNRAMETAVELELASRRQIPIIWFDDYLRNTDSLDLYAEWREEDKSWGYVLANAITGDKYVSMMVDSADHQTGDLPGRETVIQRYVKHAEDNLAEGSIFYYTDEIGERLSNFKNELTPDTLKLASLYKSELSKIGIETEFTFEWSESDDQVSDDLSGLGTQFQNAALFGEESYVRAEFPNPFQTLLSRSAGVVISSVLILFVMTFAFIRMIRAYDRQKKLQQMKNDFIDQVSHELRTPLSTLTVALEAIGKGNLSEDKKNDYVNISSTEVNRLSEMVDSILINSIGQETLVYKSVGFDPNEQIRNSILRANLKFPGFLKSKVNVKEGTHLTGDPFHFEHMLMNLIENAFIHNTSADKSASLEVYQNPDELIIRVEDNGPGIPENMKEKIFEKYVRVSERIKGFGIGLFYVKNVAQRMNGDIFVQSGNSGTSFELTFPAR